jgi:hypothetical protein
MAFHHHPKNPSRAGGNLPENLPVAEDLKKVASREKKRLKDAAKPLPKKKGKPE